MRFSPLFLLAFSSATLLSANVRADVRCSGHEFLTAPRPEASCTGTAPQIFESPDQAVRALVFPADASLNVTPDMESRVEIRSKDGEALASKDHSSPGGAHGYFVHTAKWSPDSQFLVYSLVSSGGHSPWSFPVMVYSRKRAQFARFSDMIGGKPTLLGGFSFSGAHGLTAVTWKRPGDLEKRVSVTVDLEKAFEKLPASPR